MQTKAEILDEGAMKRAITRISYEILEKNHNKKILLVGICTRGKYLAQRLAKRLTEQTGEEVLSMPLDISSLRDDIPKDERMLPQLVQDIDISQYTIILVDDVLYTGRTVRAAMEALCYMGRAACVQLAVLVDRGHRELPIRPDYIGKNVPTSHQERVCVWMQEIDGEDKVVILEA